MQKPFPPGEKPLLRGVSHEVAAAFAALGWLALVRGAPGPRAVAAATVYGLALTMQFGISALYHRPRWGARARLLMRRLDHAAIFVLIAGTYTPLCLLIPEGGGHTLLTGVWAAAAAGVVLSIAWPMAPKWLYAGLCVGLGWAVVPSLPALHEAVGARGLALIMAGGAAYTIGALVYASRRPDPFPRVFGYHEVFHALVIVAALCHYVAVAGVVGALR